MACVSFGDGSGSPRSSFARATSAYEEMPMMTLTTSEQKRANSQRYKTIVETIPRRYFSEVPENLDIVREEEQTLRGAVREMMDHSCFQISMATCILTNAVVIGGETDYPELDMWSLVETVFLVVFTMELVIRIYAVGVKDFFATGEDQLWNVFDFLIVGLGLFDFVVGKITAIGGDHHADADSSKSSSGGVSTLFRMVRLLRILRIFKIVRFLKQLYLLAFGFVEAAQAIFWVTVLMFFVLYICSIIMVRTYGRLPSTGSDDYSKILGVQFRCISTSMLSLFELMSNPGNLALYHDLMDDFPMLTLFLIAFVIFGSFGMIALLTGVISESMFEKNQMRAQEERQERELKRELLKGKCIELFASVEHDAADEASLEDLEELLPFVSEMFEKLGFEYMKHDFANIISICDKDDSGSISEAEFVAGILSLCDGVRAATIQEVYYLLSRIDVKVQRMDRLNDEVKRTSACIPGLRKDIDRILQKMDSQETSPAASGSLSQSINAGQLKESTETSLSEMRVSLASTMDSHAQMLLKKIDDLTANFKDAIRRPDPLAALNGLPGNLFTLPEADTGNKGKVQIEFPPFLAELWPDEPQRDAKGHCSDQHITPLSPPPAVNAATSVPGCTPNGDQHFAPLSSAGAGKMASGGLPQSSQT